MNEKFSVRIVDLQGDYFEFGKVQGEEIKNSLLFEKLKKLASENNHSNVRKAEELLEQFSPNVLEEIAGLQASLELEKDTAMQFSGYDIVFPKMGCTTLVTDGAYIRNYDFSPMLYDARLVLTNPDNGYATVGFSQQIIGRLDGMNEKGLVVGLHFVNNEERAEGFFATTIVRMLLEQCANIEEAIQFITTVPHGYCYNYSITDRSGKSIIVEAAPDRQMIIDADPLVCTNHFETESLRDWNRNDVQLQGSLARKRHVHALLKQDYTTTELFHHFNDGESPLFFHHYREFFGTLHTVVYVPETLSVMIGIGQNSQPLEFSLEKHIEGTIQLPRYLEGQIESVFS